LLSFQNKEKHASNYAPDILTGFYSNCRLAKSLGYKVRLYTFGFSSGNDNFASCFHDNQVIIEEEIFENINLKVSQTDDPESLSTTFNSS
jgi:hypothetical protein